MIHVNSFTVAQSDRTPVVHYLHDSILVKRGSYGPQCEKTCLRGFANNTGADQPAHPRRLISAFVIRLLQSTI